MLSTEQVQILSTEIVVTPPALRPYQKKFIADIYAHIKVGAKRILGVAATGSGKTVVMAQVIAHAVAKGRRVMIVVHRDSLIEQSYSELCSFGLNDCGFIKYGWQENRDSLIQTASVQTLPKRDWWHQYPVDLVVLDEAHLTAFASVTKQMMAEIYPQAIYLGLTATPWRLNKRESLGDIFEALAFAPMPYELINSGFLVKPAYFSPSVTDLKKVGTAANGDFDQGQLALACDRPELIQQIVRDWHNLAYGRRTIAFTVNVSHARNLAAAFTAAGVPSAYVDGTMPPKVINSIYAQLAAAEILLLASCLKVTEGFNLPSVSAIISTRPTHSKSLHFQMLGRGLRLSPKTGKTDCIVLDSSGNVQRHGFVEDIKQISLEPGFDSTGGEASKKVCPPEHGGCGAILYAFHMRCYECGYLFEQPKKVYLVPELEQLLSSEDKERYEFYRSKLREAYQKSFAPGWAAMVFKERYGHWSPDVWAIGAIFGDNPKLEQRTYYLNHLSAIAKRLEKPQAWIQRYMNLEFGNVDFNFL